jgi:hypothetical protein
VSLRGAGACWLSCASSVAVEQQRQASGLTVQVAGRIAVVGGTAGQQHRQPEEGGETAALAYVRLLSRGELDAISSCRLDFEQRPYTSAWSLLLATGWHGQPL